VFDAETGTQLSRFGKDRQGWVSKFLPGGKEMMTAGVKGDLHIWEATTGRHLRSLGTLEQGAIQSLHMTSGGQSVWWSGEYQQLGLRDLKTGKDLRLLKDAHHHGNGRLAVSPDEQWLAMGSRVWDLSTGKVISQGENVDRTRPCVISRDGKLLAYGDEDRIVIWEKQTRQKIHTFTSEAGAVGEIHGLSFSPDGTLLAAAGDAGTMVWDMTGMLSEKMRVLPALAMDPDELEQLWKLLGSTDGWEGYQVGWKLAAGGVRAIGFLSKRLRPAEEPSEQELRDLRVQLKHEDFSERDFAARRLIDLGIVLKPEELELLRRPDPNALPANAAIARPENAKPRLGPLLPPPVLLPLPERVRHSRALATLDRIGIRRGGEAAKLLESLASGHPGSPLTREAKAALKRIRARE